MAHSKGTEMKRGLSIPPFIAPGALVEVFVEAEKANWDGVFLWDSLNFAKGDAAPDVYDAWTVLAAAAQVTSRVTIGTYVTPLTRRRPWQLAKQIHTVDHLSGGRVVLGVGLGYPPDADFADFGETTDPRERGVLLDESLDLLDSLLRAGRVDHDGARYHVHTDLRPQPVQRPRPPIWVASVAPFRKPLRRSAKWDGVAPLGREFAALSPAELAEYIAPVRPDGRWDVVAVATSGVPAADYAAAGATWLLESPYQDDPRWAPELLSLVRQGPQA